MAEKKIKEYSIQEYLAQEEKALEKSEYDSGRIVGMSGGTIDHGIIGSNANIALGNAIDKKNLACIPINSEVRVYIDASDSFVYPDCGDRLRLGVGTPYIERCGANPDLPSGEHGARRAQAAAIEVVPTSGR